MRSKKPRPLTHLDKRQAAERLFRPAMFLTVLRWLKRLGVAPRDLHDVGGDVWLSAAKSWHTYDPKLSRPERWLNGIAVHAATNYHERRSRRPEVLTCVPPHVVDGAPDAVTMLGAMTTQAEVTAALRAIDPALASILVQHDLDGISMNEVARSMKRPLSTAYKMRTRALAALRSTLERRARENDRPRRALLSSLERAIA
jgi:RNA polymerase sigma-70 factor, ECF subfamily